jgi:hypothetical protein
MENLMKTLRWLMVLVGAGLLSLTETSVWAQGGDPLLTPPPNVVLPNPNGVPVGPFGGLEGGAYVARVDDPSSAWFNPAGLSRAKTGQISGSAGLYQFTGVSPSTLPNSGDTLQQIPNLVGFSTRAIHDCTLGFAIVTSNSWNQESDSELIQGSAADGERFGYSADAKFTKRNLNLSGGCQKGRLRYGVGAAFSVTSLRLVDTVSDRVSSSTGLGTLLLSTRKTGSTLQLRPILGVQYDPSATWRVGLVMRTPAATLHRSGNYAVDGTLNTGGASEGISIFDNSAKFTYKMPWEFQAGAAYIGTRAQAEFDVQQFTGVSAYSLLASGNPIIIYRDAGQGGPPTIEARPFDGVTSASRAITNVTVGGHYQLTADHSYKLHLGFTTDLSPVAPEDQIFDRIDMNAWTIGLSGKASKFVFSGGVNFRRGSSDNVFVRDLLTGESLLTSLEIKTTALIYSLSYEF